jgi:hypothetical protein
LPEIYCFRVCRRSDDRDGHSTGARKLEREDHRSLNDFCIWRSMKHHRPRVLHRGPRQACLLGWRCAEVREANLVFSSHLGRIARHITLLGLGRARLQAVPLDRWNDRALAPEGWCPSHTWKGPDLPPSDTFFVTDGGDTTSCTETR